MPTQGIEPGPAGWQVGAVPRRHSDIHLQMTEFQLFINKNKLVTSEKRCQECDLNESDLHINSNTISRACRPHWTMRFPNVYDSASTPGIEPGSPAWELDTIPQRHSDIHLKRTKLKLFIKQEIPSRLNKHKNLKDVLILHVLQHLIIMIYKLWYVNNVSYAMVGI